MNKLIKTLVLGCSTLLAAASAQAETVTMNNKNTGAPQPGTWNTQFMAARNYAVNNGLPIVASYSSSGCPHCNKLKNACNESGLQSWLSQTGIVFIYSESGPTSEKNWVKGTSATDKSAKPNSSGNFPYVRIFWPAGGVDSCFSGRSSQIPASGRTLADQFKNVISNNLGVFLGGGSIIVQPIVEPVIGSEWAKSRKIYGVVRDDRLIVGRIELTLGKVSKSGSKKGQAKVSAKLMGLDGKSKSFRADYCAVDSQTDVSLSGAAGSLQVTVSGNSFSGLVNGMTADTAIVPGGNLPDGAYCFMMEGLSELDGYPVLTQFLPTEVTPLRFKVVNSKPKFDGKATIKWNRADQHFYASRVGNEAGMSLSYNKKTGLFKGTFKIYTSKKAGSKTSNSAKATGFVSAAGGNGVVTVKKASFTCEIFPAK